MPGQHDNRFSGRDLNEESLLEAMTLVRQEMQQRPFIHRYETHRIREPEITVRDIAYPPHPWTNIEFFASGGESFYVWVHWDGRARIDRGREPMLRLPAPAGDLLRAMFDRQKARG